MNKSTRTVDCAYGRLRQRLRVGELMDRELSDFYRATVEVSRNSSTGVHSFLEITLLLTPVPHLKDFYSDLVSYGLDLGILTK
jgi:hypothetical protein